MDTVFSEEALADLENAGRARAQEATQLEANLRQVVSEIAGLNNAIASGTQEAERLRSEAEAKVDRILAEANARVEKIRADAATEVTGVLDIVANNRADLERKYQDNQRLTELIQRAHAYAGHAQRVVDRERTDAQERVSDTTVTLPPPVAGAA